MSSTPAVRAAGPTVLPGTDPRRTAGLLEAELGPPHLVPLPELPARGHHAAQTGRTAAMLTELYTELTSYGWRLVDRPGADHQRAAHQLSADVDTLADVRGERAELHGADPAHEHPDHDDGGSALVLDLLGPVSLAARLHLPSGERALTDHGARRDLADSLAAGVVGQCDRLRRVVGPSSLTVVLAEPDHRRARAGRIPTVSGYRTIRSLPRDEARPMVGAVIEALRSGGADKVYLDTGVAPDLEHLEDYRTPGGLGVDGFGLPAVGLDAADWERAAALVEQGCGFLASLLHPDDGGGDDAVSRTTPAAPEVSALMRRLSEPWQRIGMPAESLSAFTLTPYGVQNRDRTAALSEASAMRLTTRIRDAAEALTDRIRSR